MTETQGDLLPNVSEPSKRAAYLVVVGASAGGVDALSRLLARVPADLPAPIVVAQHLDPARPSQLAEILARAASLPVERVDTRARLVPGHVYVVPSNQDVEIIDGWMALKPGSAGAKPSIDLLFRTAAHAYGAHLVAVVLTGTGSDGAIGARAVHDAGGIVVVQNPATAAFPGMPRSLAPAVVDMVAEVDDVGPLLHALTTGAHVPRLPDDERELRGIFEQVRRHRGLDFGRYQRPTVLRRLERRLAATQSESVSAYREYLAQHPEEEERLVAALLINVTDFFRDRALYAHLRDYVLPDLLENARERHDAIRIWSAGCATGEEPYSLAILVRELLNREPRDDTTVRIFATDVDAEAIAFARRGVYPSRSLSNLAPDQIAGAFTRTDDEYEVVDSIRDLIIFGTHDLGRASPFRNTDLVVCRNVLIYFTPELRQRALQAFAFSIRPGGFLVLGSAETVRPLQTHFDVDQPGLHIYQRNAERPPSLGAGIQLETPLPPQGPGRAASQSLVLPRAITRGQAAPLAAGVLQQLPIGIVSVTSRYDIEFINAAARRLLGIHEIGIGQDLLHSLAGISTALLRDCIDAALRTEQAQTIEETARTTGSGERRYLHISCAPERILPANLVKNVMLTVTDISASVLRRLELEDACAQRDAELERARERVAHLSESNRKLQAANDKLAEAEQVQRTLNEQFATGQTEVQASAQELETYNEELQATNEQLETVNEELVATNQELQLTINDLEARFTDLTQQRAASEDTHVELAAVLSLLTDAVAIIDRTGHTLRTNLAYDALMLMTSGVLVPLDDAGLPLADDANPLARSAQGQPFTAMFNLRLGDGSTHAFRATARPIPDSATSVLMVHDLSVGND